MRSPNTKAEFKQRIEALQEEVRELKVEVRVFDLNYSRLFDLVNDAAFALRLGRPLDEYVIEGLMNFKWSPCSHPVNQGEYIGSEFRFGKWSPPSAPDSNPSSD